MHPPWYIIHIVNNYNLFAQMLSGRLKELCLEGGLFSDVMFQLEDGTAAVHRPLLMARCDMMHAMFSGDFRESNAKVVSLGSDREGGGQYYRGLRDC